MPLCTAAGARVGGGGGGGEEGEGEVRGGGTMPLKILLFISKNVLREKKKEEGWVPR